MYIQKFNIVNIERAHVNLKNFKKLAKTVKYLLQERKKRRKRGRGEEKEVRKKREGKKEKLNMSEKITQFQILLF